jgi:predicted metal-dependent peptidase
VPTVAVVVDTSGSMRNEDVHAALSEVSAIARRVGVRGAQLRLLAVDAAVHSVVPVTDPRRLELRGGGGTDMRIGISAAESLQPRPDAIVVLTDGQTPWPDRPGRSRLIVGIVGEEEDAPMHGPPWATTIRIVVNPAGAVNARRTSRGG